MMPQAKNQNQQSLQELPRMSMELSLQVMRRDMDSKTMILLHSEKYWE